jgi:hypothetical protein
MKGEGVFEILDEFEVIKGTLEYTTMFPMLWRYPDGTLRLIFHVDPDQYYSRRRALESRDGGKTWQDAPVLVPREEGYAVLSDGTIMGFDIYLFPDDDGHLFGHRWVSEDNGKTVKGPEKIKMMVRAEDLRKPQPGKTVFNNSDLLKPPAWYRDLLGEKCAPAAACHFWDRGFEFDDGNIYAGGGVGFKGEKPRPRITIFRSKDNGLTWEVFSQLGADPALKYDDESEPALAIAANGDWLCATRTGDPSPLRLYRSKDAGRTWDAGAIVADFGVDPKLERLSDGALVLLYGRPNCWMKISKDNGHTWSHGFAIQFHAYTTSYMGISEVEPNVVMIAYNDEMFPQEKRIDGRPACSIKIKKLRIL